MLYFSYGGKGKPVLPPLMITQKAGVNMSEETRVSKAQQKAVNKYVKSNYDRINVTFPKGQKEIIMLAATAAGRIRKTAISKKAVDQRMERDNA